MGIRLPWDGMKIIGCNVRLLTVVWASAVAWLLLGNRDSAPRAVFWGVVVFVVVHGLALALGVFERTEEGEGE